jgi:DHA2 family multidrug resistance protein
MTLQRESAPLSGICLALVSVALPLAAFMQVIDATVANVSVPTIAGNLGASSSQGTWVITSYGVANAISLPLTGWLARRFGEVRLFFWSTALFALCSLLCGLASELGSLVVFRSFQGAVGGPMMPLTQSLLLNAYPRERRNTAIAIWSMTVSVAPVFGPLLGGYISDNHYWGWIFFINVPIGMLVFFVSRRLLDGRETPVARAPFNVVGFSLLAIGVGSLQMMLDLGNELDWFNSPGIVALAAAAGVGLCLLVSWELVNPAPLVDFRLFASRNFSIGVLCISLGMMIYLGTVVLLPLLLQTCFGYTATLAGLVMSPIGILPVCFALPVGKWLNRADPRLFVSFSFCVFAYCMHLRTDFSPVADMRFLLIPQFIQGIALAFFFSPLTALSFSDLHPGQMAGAAGLFNCLRTLFGAIGASVAATLWQRRENWHHARLSGHVTPYDPLASDALEQLGRLGLDADQSAAFLAREITSQGFIFAAAELYQLCTLIFLAMIGLIWLAGRGRRDNHERTAPLAGE